MYTETSFAYLGAASDEPPGSPVGLCVQLWEVKGLPLTIGMAGSR